MKVLYLLRHAKSDWSNAALADHDRPLAPRGRKAVRRLAAHIDKAHVRPALVLCSTALRTQQTLEGVRKALGDDVEIWMDAGLYGAGEEELLDHLRHTPPAVPSLMVIGHNPGLQDLALALVGDADDDGAARLHRKFPTGALATISIAGRWETLAAGSATLTAFVVPRELPEP